MLLGKAALFYLFCEFAAVMLKQRRKNGTIETVYAAMAMADERKYAMKKGMIAALAVLVVILAVVFSMAICKPEETAETPSFNEVVSGEEAEPVYSLSPEQIKQMKMQIVEQRLEKMMPICDALMRTVATTGSEYDADNPAFVWMSLYIAANQGVGVRDEYVVDENYDVTIPGWSVLELLHAGFADRDELISFPKRLDYVTYDENDGSFCFTGADFSALSASVSSYIMNSDGTYIVTMMLVDNETQEYASFEFHMKNNPDYASDIVNCYPMRITSVTMTS